MADYQIYNSTLKHLCQSLRDQYFHNELIPLTQVPELMNAANGLLYYPQDCSIIDIFNWEYYDIPGKIASIKRVPYEQRNDIPVLYNGWLLCSPAQQNYKTYGGVIKNPSYRYNYDYYVYTEYDKPIYLNRITQRTSFIIQALVRMTNEELDDFYRNFNTCFFEYNNYSNTTSYGNGISIPGDIRFLQYPMQWRSLKAIDSVTNTLNDLSFLNNYSLTKLRLNGYYYRGYSPQQEDIPSYWTSIYAKDLTACYNNTLISGQADLPCSALYCDYAFNNCTKITKSSLPYNAITMYQTFNNCTNLEIVEGRNICLPLSGFQYTFNNCTNLKHFNTSVWYTHPITYSPEPSVSSYNGLFGYGCFNTCSNLENLPDITTPNNVPCYISTPQNLYISGFSNCYKLKSLGNWLCDIVFYCGNYSRFGIIDGYILDYGLNNLKQVLNLKNVQSLTIPYYNKSSYSRQDYSSISLNFMNIPNLKYGITGDTYYSDQAIYLSESYGHLEYSNLKSPFYNFKTILGEKNVYYSLSTQSPISSFDINFMNNYTVNIGGNKEGISFHSYNINLCGNFYLFSSNRLGRCDVIIENRKNYNRKLNFYIPRDESKSSSFYNTILGANNGYVTNANVLDSDSVVLATIDMINFYNLEKNIYIYTYNIVPECFNQFL